MLKTLRITSLAALAVAVLGVIAMMILGFKGDPAIRDELAKPSVTEEYKGRPGKAAVKADEVHPLVNQARLFALRINPPPPPPPPTPPPGQNRPPQDQPHQRQVAAPPPPPVQTAKFELLATVRYETDPSKSLALLKSGTKIEWFRQGEKAGHLDIDEVRDGSAIFSQGGRNPQTLYVPVKTAGKSLLKDEQTAVASAQPSARPGASAAIASRTELRSEAAQAQGDPQAAGARPQFTSRIQRSRAEPPPPTPQEQIQSLESTISGIQEIMSQQDDSVSEEDRRAEQATWMELLNILRNEKANLAVDSGQTVPEENGPPEMAQVDDVEQIEELLAEDPAVEVPPSEEQPAGDGSQADEGGQAAAEAAQTETAPQTAPESAPNEY